MADYDKYIERMKKISALIPTIRIILGILVAFICAALIWGIIFLFRIGTFITEVNCEDLTYGDEPVFSAEAYKSEVVYYFAKTDSEDWSEQVPYLVGSYRIKAVSKTFWNTTKESIGTFEINRRDLFVEYAHSEIQFDEEPIQDFIYSNLAQNDRVSGEKFTYSLPEQIGEGLIFGPQNGDVTVINKKNEDVSYCYNVISTDSAITVTKKPITICPKQVTFEYDGNEHFCSEIEEIEGSIGTDRKWVVEIEGSSTIPGITETLIKDYSIIDANGEDITASFSVDTLPGEMIISKRQITVAVDDVEKIYDGKEIKSPKYEIVKGSLLEGDRLKATFKNLPVNAGKGSFSVDFVVMRGQEDVSEYYDITRESGNYVINKRPITIKSGSASRKDNGKALFRKACDIVSGSLADGNILYIPEITYLNEVGSVSNVIRVRINDNEDNEVTSNYEITYEYGTLTIYANSNNNDGSGEGGGNGGSKSDKYDKSDKNENNNGSYSNYYSPIVGHFSPQITRKQNDEVKNKAIVMFSVVSQKSLYLHFRVTSMGDYDAVKGEWQEAKAYEKDVTLNPLFMTSSRLLQSDLQTQNVVIYFSEKLRSSRPLILPYYSLTCSALSDYYYYYYSNDISYDTTELMYKCRVYDVELDELLRLKSEISKDSDEENEYRKFVYEQYLNVDPDIAKVLNRLIDGAGLDRSSETIISDVAKYIRNVGIYNTFFEEYPDDIDPIVYFLTISHEGICQHFAAAATLMFRVLGIPARYTMGYLALTDGNGLTTNVTEGCAHAWVEVYIDGLGWVAVEVTPPDESNKRNRRGEKRLELTVKMIDVQAVFNNEPVTSNEFIINKGSLAYGDTFYCNGTGEGTYVGTYKNECTDYYILDMYGNDVTNEYSITCIPGTIIITPATLSGPTLIELTEKIECIDLEECGWSFDILPVFESADSFLQIKDNKLYGSASGTGYSYAVCDGIDFNHDGKYEVESSRWYFKVKCYEWSNVRLRGMEYSVAERKGLVTKSVDEDYNIFEDYFGGKYNCITVAMASGKKEFDGETLRGDSAELINGKLYPGDRIVASSDASILYTGSVVNKCRGLYIYDSEGRDVTDKYLIDVYDGILTVKTCNITGDIDYHLNIWTTLKMEDLFKNAVENIRNWQAKVISGEDVISVKNGAFSIVRSGEVVLEGYNEKDINEDGVPEYTYFEQVRVTATVPAGIWLMFALFLGGVVCLVIFQIRKKQEEQKDLFIN